LVEGEKREEREMRYEGWPMAQAKRLSYAKKKKVSCHGSDEGKGGRSYLNPFHERGRTSVKDPSNSYLGGEASSVAERKKKGEGFYLSSLKRKRRG